MPKPKALLYAEETLGVHEVYETALKARSTLDEIFTDLDALYTDLRSTKEALADREVEITVEERVKHPDHSDTALERHCKIVRQQDEHCKELRARINSIESDIDGRKYDRSLAEKDIDIATARMHELGGYFAYLVQMKQQSSQPKPTEA